MATSGLDALFERNIGTLAKTLDTSVQAALLEYERLREAGQKGELADIYISLLRSSVLCKLPWLRIDLCDEKGRNDLRKCSADYDVPVISEKIYNEAEKLMEQKRWDKDYKLQQAWLTASDKCFQMLEKYFSQIIGACDTSKTTNCRWHFGQFLGNTVAVWEGGESKA